MESLSNVGILFNSFSAWKVASSYIVTIPPVKCHSCKLWFAEHKNAIRSHNMDYAIVRHYAQANHFWTASLKFLDSTSQSGGKPFGYTH